MSISHIGSSMILISCWKGRDIVLVVIVLIYPSYVITIQGREVRIKSQLLVWIGLN